MDIQELGLLIIKGFALFLIIAYAVKFGIKEALSELKNEENKKKATQDK